MKQEASKESTRICKLHTQKKRQKELTEWVNEGERAKRRSAEQRECLQKSVFTYLPSKLIGQRETGKAKQNSLGQEHGNGRAGTNRSLSKVVKERLQKWFEDN